MVMEVSNTFGNCPRNRWRAEVNLGGRLDKHSARTELISGHGLEGF